MASLLNTYALLIWNGKVFVFIHCNSYYSTPRLQCLSPRLFHFLLLLSALNSSVLGLWPSKIHMLNVLLM